MPKLLQKLLIGTGSVLCLIYIGLWLLEWQVDKGIPVATLVLDERLTIKITRGFCDVGCPYSYQLFSSREPLGGQQPLGVSNGEKVAFELLRSSDNDVVAIVEESATDVVLMFYEISTQNEYPGNGSFDGGETVRFVTPEAPNAGENSQRYYYRANRIIDKIDSQLVLAKGMTRRELKISQ